MVNQASHQVKTPLTNEPASSTVELKKVDLTGDRAGFLEQQRRGPDLGAQTTQTLKDEAGKLVLQAGRDTPDRMDIPLSQPLKDFLRQYPERAEHFIRPSDSKALEAVGVKEDRDAKKHLAGMDKQVELMIGILENEGTFGSKEFQRELKKLQHHAREFAKLTGSEPDMKVCSSKYEASVNREKWQAESERLKEFVANAAIKAQDEHLAKVKNKGLDENVAWTDGIALTEKDRLHTNRLAGYVRDHSAEGENHPLIVEREEHMRRLQRQQNERTELSRLEKIAANNEIIDGMIDLEAKGLARGRINANTRERRALAHGLEDLQVRVLEQRGNESKTSAEKHAMARDGGIEHGQRYLKKDADFRANYGVEAKVLLTPLEKARAMVAAHGVVSSEPHERLSGPAAGTAPVVSNPHIVSPLTHDVLRLAKLGSDRVAGPATVADQVQAETFNALKKTIFSDASREDRGQILIELSKAAKSSTSAEERQLIKSAIDVVRNSENIVAADPSLKLNESRTLAKRGYDEAAIVQIRTLIDGFTAGKDTLSSMASIEQHLRSLKKTEQQELIFAMEGMLIERSVRTRTRELNEKSGANPMEKRYGPQNLTLGEIAEDGEHRLNRLLKALKDPDHISSNIQADPLAGKFRAGSPEERLWSKISNTAPAHTGERTAIIQRELDNLYLSGQLHTEGSLADSLEVLKRKIIQTNDTHRTDYRYTQLLSELDTFKTSISAVNDPNKINDIFGRFRNHKSDSSPSHSAVFYEEVLKNSFPGITARETAILKMEVKRMEGDLPPANAKLARDLFKELSRYELQLLVPESIALKPAAAPPAAPVRAATPAQPVSTTSVKTETGDDVRFRNAPRRRNFDAPPGAERVKKVERVAPSTEPSTGADRGEKKVINHVAPGVDKPALTHEQRLDLTRQKFDALTEELQDQFDAMENAVYKARGQRAPHHITPSISRAVSSYVREREFIKDGEATRVQAFNRFVTEGGLDSLTSRDVQAIHPAFFEYLKRSGVSMNAENAAKLTGEQRLAYSLGENAPRIVYYDKPGTPVFTSAPKIRGYGR